MSIVSPQKNERPVKQLVKYMIDIAMGMHYISEKGLVHRVSEGGGSGALASGRGGREGCNCIPVGYTQVLQPVEKNLNYGRGDVQWRKISTMGGGMSSGEKSQL